MGEAKRRKLAEQASGAGTVETASAWPLTDRGAFDEVARTLGQLGVGYGAPGFHDSPAFVRAERSNSNLIELVGRFVESRAYGSEELGGAESVIRVAAQAIQAAVEADGRPGLCVVASGVLSRILDALGIWNYCAKATLTVSFPPEVSSSMRYFYSIDRGAFVAPHMVVVAPPFTVVDVTARYQLYDKPGMAEALPRIVMAKEFLPYQWSVEDIVSPEFEMLRGGGRVGLERYLQVRNQPMLRALKQLPGRQVIHNGSVLRYVVCGVGGYAEQVADLTANANINGRAPIDLLEKDILPRLAATPHIAR